MVNAKYGDEAIQELCDTLKKHIGNDVNDKPIFVETEEGKFECDSLEDALNIMVAKILHEESKVSGGH